LNKNEGKSSAGTRIKRKRGRGAAGFQSNVGEKAIVQQRAMNERTERGRGDQKTRLLKSPSKGKFGKERGSGR